MHVVFRLAPLGGNVRFKWDARGICLLEFF